LVEPLEVADDVELDRLVERRQRLVEQEQAGLGGQRAGERDALRLAARDGARESVGRVADAELREERRRP
jgi:hypothetical protein